jgi:hypothetical protein
MAAAMRSAIKCLGCVCTLMLLACKASDASLLSPQRYEPNAGASGCGANIESCNGRDDDCDGVVDETADTDCSRDHADSRCVAGQCLITQCAPGYLDCNDSSADGCERAEADVACGTCGRHCAAADAAMPPVRDSAPLDVTTDHVPEQDAAIAAGDDDAGSGCSKLTESCDGLDNDCDGAIDEGGVCDACIALHLSGQTAECDRCACEKCSAKTALCVENATSGWPTRCVSILQCYGKANLKGDCPGGDCYSNGRGPCANEVMNGSFSSSGFPTCVPAPVTTPCSAATVVRQQCLLTTCSDVCKF